MKYLLKIAAIALAFTFVLFRSAAQQVLYCGHSHNDYVHQHPLFDALGNGFKSVEIDVWLHHGKLVVDHEGTGLDSKKDFEELYLRPVSERVKQHGGWVYDADSTPTIFMVEFKNDGEACYLKLKELIAKYKGLFCDRYGHGGPVKILITGNKPWKTLLQGNELYATADGNISQSADSTPAYILERVSDPYGNFFTWRGKGTMPALQKERLDSLVKIAHEHNRQIRFYALPQNEKVWKAMMDAGVDWINIDKLDEFASFYKNYALHHSWPPSCHCFRM